MQARPNELLLAAAAAAPVHYRIIDTSRGMHGELLGGEKRLNAGAGRRQGPAAGCEGRGPCRVHVLVRGRGGGRGQRWALLYILLLQDYVG